VSKQFADKAEMLKKGATSADMHKKLAAPQKAIQEAKAEFDSLVADVFAAC
jgi:hypothetical protein